MIRILLILGLCCILYDPTLGQDMDRIKGFKLGVTPSALMNRWIGYQGKVAYTYKNFEVEANVGYISGTDNDEPHSGYRIRPVVKYYLSESDQTFYYIGFGGLHRKVNIDANGTFGRFNNTFFQEFDFKLTHTLNGLYGMAGSLIPIHKDRFFLDFGVGLGRGVLTVEHSGVPDDAVLVASPPLFTYDSRSEGKISNHMIYFMHMAFSYRF